MIEVTEKAIEKISGIIESDDDYYAETTLFRIQVTGKTATDYKYGIGLEFRKEDYTETESFFDLEKFSMIVDERSLRVLDGATVDYKEDLKVMKILSNDSDIDMKGLLAGVLNKGYINALKSNKLKETAHQMNRRTDFKIISYDFDEYLKENENKESPVINRIIDENGDLIEIRE